jgi:hypothetical protein
MNPSQIIRSKVEYLVKLINEQRPGFLEKFKSNASIDQIHQSIPSQLIPTGLTEIYSCIRGVKFEQSDMDLFDLIPGYELLALDEIDDIYRSLNDGYAKYPILDEWKSDMIPFLRHARGDLYCIRSLENNQSIYSLYKDDFGFYVYQDMEHFLDVSIACYEQKAYYLDEEQYLVRNYELRNMIYYEAAISRGLKPDEIRYPDCDD